jgi:hypothetical protein
MIVTTEITGIPAAQKLLLWLVPNIREQSVTDLAEVALGVIKSGAAKHTKTGTLQSSVFNKEVSPFSRLVGHDLLIAPHAPFPIHGTKPHKIFPKKAGGVLAWQVGGTTIFAKYVNHPGNKPDDYIQGAIDTAAAQLPKIIGDIIKGAP